MKKSLFVILFLLAALSGSAQRDTTVAVGDSLRPIELILPDSSESAKKPFDTSRGVRFRKAISGTASTFKKVVGIDSLTARERPRIIFLRSMLVPGTGQIMNKDYLKVPLVYGAAAGGLYFIRRNNLQYKEYLSYVVRLEESGLPSMPHDDNPNGPSISKETYARAASSFKRYRDLTWIGFGAGWMLFAVEANVAAHLKNFDISDDISVKWSPTVIPLGGTYAAGVKLSFNFK